MQNINLIVHEVRRDTKEWFPDKADDLGFMGLALAGELGELCNLIKKVERGDLTLDEARKDIGEEATDVLIYLCEIFGILGISPSHMYDIKRRKNVARFANGFTKRFDALPANAEGYAASGDTADSVG